MKYIDADKLKEKIEKKYLDAKEKARFAGETGTSSDCTKWDAVVLQYENVLRTISSLQQEQPKLTQVPRIEQETQKKGWMNYGLLISEIGLHRSNAIDRIKETKERATEIKRNIAPHDLAILSEYMESVGAEIVLCCLQQYCMDFMFTQDEVNEILQQEQSEVDLEKEIEQYTIGFIGELRNYKDWAPRIARFARYFYELGLNARKEE